MTGLNNRRGFYLLVDPALEAVRRDGRDCLLAFIDADGLKQVNDRYGHVVGDNLIADIGRILRATLCSSDILARVGGDEFCVLAVDPAADGAALRQRLLDAFELFNDNEIRPYRLSASIGVMTVQATDARTIDQLLVHADELMYEDKNARPRELA